MNKSKIKGLIFGCAIGDALGMPIESFSKEKIQSKYKRLTNYIQPVDHKWFNGKESGTTTDDTSLLTATVESIIDSNGLDMDSQVKWHIKAIEKSDEGMGDTTRIALRSLSNDKHWSNSGLFNNGKGVGNGVAMKVSPIAAYFSVCENSNSLPKILSFIVDYNNMTHKTKISLIGAVSIFSVAVDCLLSTKKLNINHLINNCLNCFEILKDKNSSSEEKDDLTLRLKEMFDNYNNWSKDDIINKYNGGYCYVYDSVPFALSFFLKNPYSIESLYDVINSGGDTDTNGAIVGSLLGSLNGIEIFPEHLINGLKDKDYLNDLSERFYYKLIDFKD